MPPHLITWYIFWSLSDATILQRCSKHAAPRPSWKRQCHFQAQRSHSWMFGRVARFGHQTLELLKNSSSSKCRYFRNCFRIAYVRACCRLVCDTETFFRYYQLQTCITHSTFSSLRISVFGIMDSWITGWAARQRSPRRSRSRRTSPVAKLKSREARGRSGADLPSNLTMALDFLLAEY